MPFIGDRYPIGLFSEPTGDLEHAGGIHSVQMNAELAQTLEEAEPGLWLEWSVSAGHWNNPYRHLATVFDSVADELGLP